jgi:hypothetical protein
MQTDQSKQPTPTPDLTRRAADAHRARVATLEEAGEEFYVNIARAIQAKIDRARATRGTAA